MEIDENKKRNWTERGKTVGALIKELESFENQELLVVLSIDGGEEVRPVSLVGKKDNQCLIAFVPG
ncbi:hypothetical protein GCM10010520_15790 [Rhizobium viscosum]|uniref:Uncharacterized protein n=1 Tax=Rhizobium viscosum TaxID=1673 RepID=A0ABR9IXD8_RHIVS|nr:hypothetical protein [Rhizobium viscosum]MBE1507879.1 hypothetical protein [Rhizobium viscosum]